MASLEYNLFRCKLIKPEQRDLFPDNLTPAELFIAAINARPSGELRLGYTWHIGNLTHFNTTTGYFAVGRTTSSTVSKFDQESGNFVEEKQDASPYTHCVFDADIGLLGIAKNTRLAPTTYGVAANLQRLLSETDPIRHNHITVEIQPIPDPEEFLKAIQNAYSVSSFTATFRGPNPFDADEIFQKPLSVYLSKANGVTGKTMIKGEDLDREVLTGVSRSTAATGNRASARIKRNKNAKPRTIHMKTRPAGLTYDEEQPSPKAVLKDIKSIYGEVRRDKRK